MMSGGWPGSVAESALYFEPTWIYTIYNGYRSKEIYADNEGTLGSRFWTLSPMTGRIEICDPYSQYSL